MIYALGNRQPILPANNEYFVADNAAVIGSVVIEKNASVWFNAVVRGDCDTITIGENSNVQDGSVLHTDHDMPLTIGKDCTIGHMVMLHGCTIGENSLIGIGAVVLNGAKIGKNCLIGAKSLITENTVIPDNSVVMGAPGKVVKKVSETQAKMLGHSATHYVENSDHFRNNLIPIE